MKELLLLISFSLVCSFVFAQETAADTLYENVMVDTTEYYTQGDTAVSYYDDYEDTTQSGYVSPEALASTKNYMNEDPGSKYPEDKWKKIVGDKDYEEEKPKEKKPLWKPRKFNFSFGNLDPAIMRMISFIIVFILFAFILFYVWRNTKFSKSVKKMKVGDISGPVENIEELDTDHLLNQALADGDLRLAVRIQYLLLLKKLNEVGLIAWKKDKTNRDYLSELYGRSNTYDNVRDLTLAYELVWYGERSVSQDSFQRLSGEFDSVNRQITQVQPSS